MLKIKDNIDLEELEKFSFDYCDEFEVDDAIYIKEIQSFDNGSIKIIIDENSRFIEIMSFSDEPRHSSILQNLDILYDIIKADMVEKVVEDGRI